jgi:DNA-directed RNA polymerase alpha subunit
MEISNLGQVARFTPKQLLAVNGFGKKCLYEIADILEKFYSSLDVQRLALFADIVDLWRPYFPHPEHVPIVPCDPGPSNGSPTTAEPTEVFDPSANSHAQLSVGDLPISVRAQNVLAAVRIRTLDELAQMSPSTLIKVGN